MLTPEQIEFILSHEHDSVPELALSHRREDLTFLLQQIAGRQIARKKMQTWYQHPSVVYPKQLSLEQSSSELTARYKQQVLKSHAGNRLIDLTGGMGVDFSFLAPLFQHSCYVERDAYLCELAQHNFRELGLSGVEVVNAEAEDFLQQMDDVADVMYIDPARRDNHGNKVVRIEECSPNLAELYETIRLKSKSILVKYSPMLDISLALRTLKHVREVHVVSVANECKELLLLLDNAWTNQPVFHAVNIVSDTEQHVFSFTDSEEEDANITFANEVSTYLYEPHASLMKIGRFGFMAQQTHCQKLHPNSHLFTASVLIDDFPGRRFKVDEVIHPSKDEVKRLKKSYPKVNLAVRNYPQSVEQIRKKTGIKEGGDIYVFATTLHDGQKVWVVTHKV